MFTTWFMWVYGPFLPVYRLFFADLPPGFSWLSVCFLLVDHLFFVGLKLGFCAGCSAVFCWFAACFLSVYRLFFAGSQVVFCGFTAWFCGFAVLSSFTFPPSSSAADEREQLFPNRRRFHSLVSHWCARRTSAAPPGERAG